jgi:methionyl-tRNA formyltransferase
MKNYKIVLFGVKGTTQKIAEYLCGYGVVIDLIVSIAPTLSDRSDIADYTDLKPLAQEIGADYYAVSDYTLLSEYKFFQENTFDLGIAYGWQRIIPERVLRRFSSGVFGFHASPDRLPKGRGHSPMNWSLILDKTILYNHFFKYNTQADRGEIYSVTPFSITPHDTILTLMYKSLLCAQREIPRLVNDIRQKTLSLSQQQGTGYVFSKRHPKDGRINFSTQFTASIVNLVRGTTHPFSGAFCIHSNGHQVTVWEAWVFDDHLDFSSYQPGTVISDLYDMPIIKTIDGSLIIKHYEGPLLRTGEVLF